MVLFLLLKKCVMYWIRINKRTGGNKRTENTYKK